MALFSDGTGTVAGFNQPYGITVDQVGNRFVADSLNHRSGNIFVADQLNSRIYKISSDCPAYSNYDVQTGTCSCLRGYLKLGDGTCVFGTPILCPPNSICNSTDILSCVSGFKVNANRTMCQQCPLGTESSPDSSECISCDEGVTYRSLTQ